MNDGATRDQRLTKRRVVDHPSNGTEQAFPPGTPDRVLIADELESIRLLAEESEEDLNVPWGNSLMLDKDDWGTATGVSSIRLKPEASWALATATRGANRVSG